MYSRFVNHLEFILREGLRTSFVSDVAQRQLADIFGLVSDNQTSAGLLELISSNPAAADAATARADIMDTMVYYTGWLEERVRCRSEP